MEIILIFLIGPAIFIGILAIAIILSKTPTDEEKGEKGENETEAELNQLTGYFVILRNLRIPHNGTTTEIDLVILHEKGIYVIENKNFNGWIYGSEKATYWLQTFQKSKYKFYNPIRQNETHINALSKILKLPTEQRPRSFIVFGYNAELKKFPHNPEKYVVCRTGAIAPIINAELEKKQTIYTEEIITIYSNYLRQFT